MASFKRTPAGVYICDSCSITGDVKFGVDSSVWFSAVIRGDVAAEVGEAFADLVVIKGLVEGIAQRVYDGR